MILFNKKKKRTTVCHMKAALNLDLFRRANLWRMIDNQMIANMHDPEVQAAISARLQYLRNRIRKLAHYIEQLS